MLRLSIILPAFNVEKWIEKCIRSLEDQDLDHSNYEIIVVNDGSPDNSAKIAKDLSKEFSNLVVIDQINKGLAGARNTGMRTAKGQYILYVDPDDFIEKNTLRKLLEFSESKELEIAMFAQKLIYQNGEVTIRKALIDEPEILPGIKLFFLRTGDSACKYLIKREYLIKNNLFFFEDSVYLEDAEWSARIFAKAKRTAYENICFYNYVLRKNSLVTSGTALSDQAIISYFNCALNLKKFQKRKDLTRAQKQFLNNTIAKFTILPLAMCANKTGINKFQVVKQRLRSAGLTILNEQGVKGNRLRHIRMFNLSKNLLFVYLLMKHIFLSLNIWMNTKNTKPSYKE